MSIPSATAPAPSHPLISDARLRHLYVTLLRTRALRGENRLRGAGGAVAREAVVTATVTHLQDGDVVIPVEGDRLAPLARGHNLRRIASGKPLAGVLPGMATAEARFAFAAGYASGRGEPKKATLVFSGPGVTSLESLRPALAYAVQHTLGVVFVIETAAESTLSNAENTSPIGIYGIPVDGNDVIAVYRVAQESIQRARRGVGPTLIDCKPWPLESTSDPVRRLEQALQRRGIATDTLKERTVATFRREMAAVRSARR